MPSRHPGRTTGPFSSGSGPAARKGAQGSCGHRLGSDLPRNGLFQPGSVYVLFGPALSVRGSADRAIPRFDWGPAFIGSCELDATMLGRIHRYLRPRRRLVLTVAAVGSVVAVIVAAIALLPSAPPGGPLPTVNATLRPGAGVGTVGPGFFAVSAQSDFLSSPVTQSLVERTPLTVFRWGPQGEYVNLTTGVQYNDNGIAGPIGPDNISSFIAFCRAVHCRASLAVPGEINDTRIAVATVTYIEQTLGFRPAYWSVGNEPQTWNHFNEPWVDWRSSDASHVTPTEYALEVQRYISAIRTVDPTAQFVGIQSAGGDSVEASQWIAPVAQINGPNLAFVAYHPYPGGNGATGASLTDFFGSLTRSTAFPLGYPSAQQTIDAACACGVRLIAGEFNSALGGGYAPYLAGYPNVPYIGAGLLLAMEEGVPQVTYFTLSTPGPGFGLLEGETPRPTYYLYSVFLENLTQGTVVSASLPGAPAQVYALETVNGSRTSLFVVNANPSVNVELNLTGSGFPVAGGGTVYSWDPSAALPTVASVTGALPSTYRVPAEGVLLLDVG